MAVRGSPSETLRGKVSAYWGFAESPGTPVRRREGPGHHIVVLVSFGDEWSINGVRVGSFVAGLHRRQVTTEHGGRAAGVHVDVSPPAAYSLFRRPLHELSNSAAPLEELIADRHLAERVHDAGGWAARFAIIDEVLARTLHEGPQPDPGVVYAVRRLVEGGGQVRVTKLAAELGWSRKRLGLRFREQVGLSPKAVARLIRFGRARAAANRAVRPDWARIAAECGYYDQSHLINDFRDVTGRTPETFFQDADSPAS